MGYTPQLGYIILFANIILLILIEQASVMGFSGEVNPNCLPSDEICSFELNIEYRRNMAVYGRPEGSKLARDNARILEVKDGTLFIRNNSQCEDLSKATEREIFNAVTADGTSGFLYTINGQFPGPTLTVYEGQEVAVKVKNQLYQESLTIHWHGMRQKNTNWMDGVPTVTQCAIGPQESFMYRFIAAPAGTHWYHSHQGAQRTDGMYGALVVLPRPKQHMANQRRPDRINPTKDFVVLVQDRFPQESKLEFHNFYHGVSQGSTPCYKPAVQVDGTAIGPYEYYSGLINGKGYPLSTQIPGLPLERFRVKYGTSYRFRIINTGLLYTFKFSIDKHKLNVVASDGNELEPIDADSVYVTPGERYDVIIHADQPLASYWLRMETLHWNLASQKPIPQSVLAILDYRQAQTPVSSPWICTDDRPCIHVNCPVKEFPENQYISCVHLHDLESKHQTDITQTVGKQVFLNFHYANSTDGGIRSAINGIQHLPGTVSSNSYSKDFEHTCDPTQCADGRPCRCTNQLELPVNTLIHMVFFTQMWNSGSAQIGSSHPVHMHGHHFEVIKVGFPEIDPVTKIFKEMSADIVCNNAACNRATWRILNGTSADTYNLNVDNPPKKDTVHVPAGGYVLVRYMTDNPGFWMLHCHIENHNLEGMALIVKEGEVTEMNPPPPQFPQCGSFHLNEDDFRNALAGKKSPSADVHYLAIVIPVALIAAMTIIITIGVVYKCRKTPHLSQQCAQHYSSLQYNVAEDEDELHGQTFEKTRLL